MRLRAGRPCCAAYFGFTPLKRWVRAAGLVALTLLLAPSSGALAHAELAASDPAIDGVIEQAPPAVTLWFTERPEPRFSEIQVLDSSARRVDRGDLRPDAIDPLALRVSVNGLDHGNYTVL